MTDKQVIVDGCDVAGCEYLGLYKECKLKCGSCCPVDCKDNPNCYYKQLKRKEQECEVIVADAEVTYTHLEHRIEMCDLLGKSLKAKEQECERLRFPMKDSNYAILTKEEFEDYKKLKQTLTEIKEIAKRVCNYLKCPSPRDVRYEMDIILQKIIECEGKLWV